MPAFLRSHKVRSLMLQILFVGTILTVVVGGWMVAQRTLEERRIISGFDFLWRSTGWNVNFSVLPTSPLDPYWWFFLVGLLNTVFLGTIGLASATAVGAVVGMARTSTNELLQFLGRCYVDFFRNIPLILQVFFWYAFMTRLPGPRQAGDFLGLIPTSRGIYTPALNVGGWFLLAAALAAVIGATLAIWFAGTRRVRMPTERRRPVVLALLAGGLAVAALLIVAGRLPATPFLDAPVLQGLNLRGGFRIPPEFSALLIAMTLYGGAYIAEIVRGGFKAVGRGQMEAARSLGLRSWHVFSRIRVPLALRAMLPILANQYIWLIKATTLGIVVGFTDFFMIVALTINHSGQTLEAIGILMAGFLLVNMTLAAIFNRINVAIALKGNQARS